MHFPFPILACVLTFVIILAVVYKRLDQKQKKTMDDFWERERNASVTPATNLEEIEYLEVPIHKFAFGTLEDEQTKELENRLTELSKKRLLNLTGKTNTEIKETYGSPNFGALQEIGENFDAFSIALCEYGSHLVAHEKFEEAIGVFEYGLLIKTDISKNYTLLGDCYKALGQMRRIETLREQVEPLGLLMGPTIMTYLDDLLGRTTEALQIEDRGHS